MGPAWDSGATDCSSFAAIYEEYPRPDAALEVAGSGYVFLGPVEKKDDAAGGEVDAGAWLLRVDGQGQEVWTRDYGGEPGDSLWNLEPMPDGGMFSPEGPSLTARPSTTAGW